MSSQDKLANQLNGIAEEFARESLEDPRDDGPDVQALTFYCPISRQKCQAGKVYSDPKEKTELMYCAFWHQKECRCVFRMVEFDLFNIARCLDEARER